jgi:hypothetical protein
LSENIWKEEFDDDLDEEELKTDSDNDGVNDLN